jgi:hypothetical protein
LDHCGIAGQRGSAPNRADARFDDVRVAHVVLVEEGTQASVAVVSQIISPRISQIIL